MEKEVFSRIDPEMVESARRQPYVSFKDPLAARRNFARAVKLSNALRKSGAVDDGVRCADTSFVSQYDGRRIGVRCYRKETADSGLPVLIYLHGGAFVAGDLETEHHRCSDLAVEVGCLVVSVDYGRAPEHPYPTAAEDCYGALGWVVARAEELGADPSRVAVAGASAGGTLAAATALMAHDREGPELVLQMLLYPALDDRLATASFDRYPATAAWTREDSGHMWRCYLGEGGDRDPDDTYAVPARRTDLRGLAPAYVLTAEVDALRDEAIDYARRMQSAGVPVELHHFSRAFHGFELAAPHASLSHRARRSQVAALKAAFR